MARNQSVWGIDLGQCALKAIKLSHRKKDDQVVAEAFDYIEHPKILSQPDAEPDELIRAALEKFLSRNDVENDLLVISVPGQSGLARFVTLPPVESKKIPDIVAFEARQQIPFPLEEVVWDFQKIGGGVEEEGFALETEVGIFAMKLDMAHRHLEPFQNFGLEVEVVQFSPVALYNFAAYDYFWMKEKIAAAKAEAAAAKEEEKNKKKKKKGKGEEEASEEAEQSAAEDTPEEPADEEPIEEGGNVVIIDIGADKTDVVITDGDAIWLRSVPIGGNHFTRALSTEMKLTFAKAEHLKQNATKAPDPKRLYQAMRPVFQDFASELQRSIGYFSSTHRDRPLTKLIGVGNGFKLPGLQRFLQQNLQYDVDKVSTFAGIAGEEVVGASAFTENAPSFCVAYGLALQGLEQTPIQTNLLPREIQQARMIREKKPWALMAAAILLIGFIAVFAGNYRVYNAVHAKEWDDPTKKAQAASQKFRGWKGEYNGAIGTFNGTKENGELLAGADQVKTRDDWIEVLKVINEAVPRRGGVESDPDEVSDIREINIEFIDAAYVQNLGEWHQTMEEDFRNTMVPEEKEKAPEGEGWIFQVLGYTFFKEGEIYLVDDILKRFQTDQMREAGITHAALVNVETDAKWSPGKGSPLIEWEKMIDITLAERAQDQSGMPGDVAMPGMEDPSMYEQDQYAMPMPGDMEAYYMDSLNRTNLSDLASLKRYDFAIQFVWVPQNKEEGEGEQPAEEEF
ncbi:pilus assembly protein PilM [Kolteria novifilia]